MAAPKDREEAHASRISGPIGLSGRAIGGRGAGAGGLPEHLHAGVRLNTGRAEVLGAVRLTATNTGPTAASTVQFLFQNIGCDNDQTNGVALATSGVFTGQAAIASVVNTGVGCAISATIPGSLSPAVGDFVQLQGVRGRVDLSPAGAPPSGVDINTTVGATPSGSSLFTAPTVLRVATSAAGLSASVQTGAQLSCLAPPPHPLPQVRITEALNGAFVHHVTSLAGTAPPGDARTAAGAANNTQIRIVVADIPTGVTLNWPAVVAGTSAGSLERRTAENATTQVYEFVTPSQGTSDTNTEQFDIVPTATMGGTVAAGTATAQVQLFPELISGDAAAVTTAPFGAASPAAKPRFNDPLTAPVSLLTVSVCPPGPPPPPPPGSFFVLSVSPALRTVPAGSSDTYAVFIKETGGFNVPVTLSCSGLPEAAICSFSPNPAPPGTATMTVSTSATTPVGGFTFAIRGIAHGVTSGASAGLIVILVPNFTLELAPSPQSVTAGEEVAYTVALTAIGGFSAAVSLSCTDLPAGASCSFSPNPAELGTATLTVSTATTTPVGTVTFTVTGTGDSITRSTTTELTVTPPPFPVFTAASITNAASFMAGLTPGGIVTIFGTRLTTDVSGVVLAEQLPLPTELRGTSVTVCGLAPPLFAIANVDGQEQINLQVPYELTGQATATVVVNNNGVLSDPVEVNISLAHPGIFTLDGTAGVILHASDFRLISPSDPAALGEAVVIYATGLGPVSPAPPTGAPASASPLSFTSIPPLVSVGGIVAEVLFSGLAPGFVALYQVNIVVPLDAPSGDLDVVIQTDGQVSNSVKMTVQ